ncbi:hypothetical protein DICPUDRAFT_77678 [Dictyostelium purpureum]|uniref:Uncharacterized protein n=1 Tax=Dictyostelium purpureum TaxID=5786 RepID=F0ZHB4_DICPU|nr:uncharacterized protein DICPUDRAFT_77678 [Dictyostelium purpureum]EGC36639.1 hypothetical protein DICPUDRAFT_77678 [Dictyostelium purpureum]|eukprot:XP_003286807.1 hypothetical protein DICPUDRAFT_77678 [Dictyostelium purpureum]
MKFLRKIFKKLIILVIVIIGLYYNTGVDAQTLKTTISFLGSFENSKYNNDSNISGTVSVSMELPFDVITLYNIGGIVYDYSINMTNINSSDYSHSVLKGPSTDIYEEDYLGQFSVPLGIKYNTTTPTTFNGIGRVNMTNNEFSDSVCNQVSETLNNLLNDSASYQDSFKVILYLKSENIRPMAIASLKFNTITISNDTDSNSSSQNSTHSSRDSSSSSSNSSLGSSDTKSNNTTSANSNTADESSSNNNPTTNIPSTESPNATLNPGLESNEDGSSKSSFVYPAINLVVFIIIGVVLLI